MADKKYFIEKNNKLVCNIPMMELYIPNYFYENKWAKRLASTINSFGLVEVGIFDNGKRVLTKLLKLPVFVDFYIHEIRDNDTIEFEHTEDEKCTVLTYRMGQEITDLILVQDSANGEVFLDMITKGKLPHSVPYNKVLQLWMKNQELASISFGTASVTDEIVLAVSYRDKNDVNKEFCTVYGTGKVGEYDYSTANFRKICQYSSTFAGISYEDMNTMITTSLNRAREKREETPTPVEKIIKY